MSIDAGPRWRDKMGFTKIALTWARGVRFGRATRRIDRENEAHLSTNNHRWFESSFGPKNTYFYELFIFLCF
ncbi:hypothetical protein Hanom_Chr05g00449401 [Helianthus anomalus]